MLVNTRYAAFGIHLLISIALLLVLLAIIFFVWYPYDLIYAGGIDGLKILMGVDLVLGPLLTLIVFVPGKKGLKTDLTFIGTVQVLCLCLGMWMIYSQRPLVQVLMDDGVHLLSAADVQNHNVSVDKLPGTYPKHVMMDLPEDRTSWGTIKLMTELADGLPFSFRDDLYLPVKSLSRDQYSERIIIVQENGNEDMRALNQSERSTCHWIPITSTHITGYACHSYENGIEKLSDRQF